MDLDLKIEDDMNSIQDICKIGMSDIKSAAQKTNVYEYGCRSIALVAGNPKYRNILKNTDGKMATKFMDLFKLTSFRKEVVEVMTLLLNRRANLPNYVVALGHDFQLSVKYSKGSLMQLLIGKTYNMTLFQVPRIAINSFSEADRLLD